VKWQRRTHRIEDEAIYTEKWQLLKRANTSQPTQKKSISAQARQMIQGQRVKPSNRKTGGENSEWKRTIMRRGEERARQTDWLESSSEAGLLLP